MGDRVQIQGFDGVLVEPDGTVRQLNNSGGAFPASAARSGTTSAGAPAGLVFVATTTGAYELRVAQNLTSVARSGVIRRAPAEVSTTVLKVGAVKSSVFTLVDGTRLEATVLVPQPLKRQEPGAAFDLFAVPGGSVTFLYAADEKERRFFGDNEAVLLPPGRYRFVFAGSGAARIRLSRLNVSG